MTTTPLSVRSYECDSYNHVNNAIYLNYLEVARMDFLAKIGFDYDGLVALGYFMPVTHIDIHYKTSALYRDELEIDTQPVKLGAATGTFHQTIRKKGTGTVCAEAEVSWAVIKEGKPVRLPKEYMVEGMKPDGQEASAHE